MFVGAAVSSVPLHIPMNNVSGAGTRLHAGSLSITKLSWLNVCHLFLLQGFYGLKKGAVLLRHNIKMHEEGWKTSPSLPTSRIKTRFEREERWSGISAWRLLDYSLPNVMRLYRTEHVFHRLTNCIPRGYLCEMKAV